MASKHGPVSVSSDGLPPGLVIIADESVPIDLHSQLDASQTVGHEGSISNVKHGEVDGVCFSAEEHGASMVPNLSQLVGHLDDPDRIDDAAIVNWLQDILVEDDYGKVDCKVMIALIQKQFGSRKRNTRAWLKRAFPKSYLRRSDRNRWFCGVSLKSEHGKSVLSVKDREWFDRAVSWLHSSMEMCPTAKERCSDVHHALTQHVGQAAVHMAISAVKMVFPNIPRKTFSRIAFYVGIEFQDPTLRCASSTTEITTLNSLSEIKTEYSDSAANKLIITWLQKALIADETSRERIKTICLMIRRKFGRAIPQAKVARLIKKVFPNVIVKLKGSIYGVVWGVRIDSACHPASGWLQKAISWLHEIFEATDSSYCENMSVLFGFLSQKLGIEKDAQCLTLLREAFPNIEMKEIVDCQMVFGIKQKRNLEQVDLPIFTDEDQSHFDDVMLFLEHNSLAIDQKHSGEPSMVYSSTGTNIVPISDRMLFSSSETQVQGNCQGSSLTAMDAKLSNINGNLQALSSSLKTGIEITNSKVVQLEEHVSELLKEMSQVKDEINNLVKDNMKSVQQKDSLIIQLQQTVIMLCQQQLQKFMPADQSLPQQTLSNLLQKGLLPQNQNSEN